ncbi:hypothetical protein [Streptacidiphilus fuscans]|uniref:Uncharacterized protein n=1 Tax=Streptacidiphilus fuscans TaxID=2789292 RepID=A0A931B4C5_9ACTN|nr:hypothetical protein [Streptacidiphilus fuscans]MBF9070078.1 hypothetical protein [Streptacidiphilus fuscans]
MFQPRLLGRRTILAFAGLLVGIVGLVVQWIADPAKFSGAEGSFGISFPPGILFIVAFGLLMFLTARWWWHPVFGMLIAFWIVGLGAVADKLQPNLLSHNPGTVAGNVVMTAGLVLTFVAGLLAIASARCVRKSSVPART